jgi:small subunit ribosomal protein S1
MKKIPNTNDENDFASLYEQSLSQMNSFKPGQAIDSQIVSISKDSVFLQLGGKSEGVLDKAEFCDENGVMSVQLGDTIRAYFLSSANGELRFTSRIGADNVDTDILRNAYENGIPIEGIIEKEVKGGYQIKIGSIHAFCPFSQMGPRRSDASQIVIGKALSFKIQEYKDNGRKLIVSNRVIHEEAMQQQLQALQCTLQEGALVKGRVTSILDYGAFVDIGGVQALLPVSELSRSRVEDIRDVLKIGQEIEAVLIKVDWKNERLSLSMKVLQLDPWTQAGSKYTIESKHEGTVTRINRYGAFVALESGIEGRLQNVNPQQGTANASSNTSAKVGQKVRVQVVEIDIEKKRLALKQIASREEDDATQNYLKQSEQDVTETYNPFAALLKKKK